MATLGLFLLFVLAGLLGSLLGLGGGIIVIPVLTLLVGVDMHHAIGASLVAVIATSISSAGAYVRDHLANVRLATVLELATTSGGLLGALLATVAPGRWLSIAFALMLLYSGSRMLRSGLSSDPAPITLSPMATRLGLNGAYRDRTSGQTIPYQIANLGAGFALMIVAGVVSGMLGIGSGVLKVTAMDQAMKLPIKVSTATSNLMIGVTAAASAWYYYAHGLIDPTRAVPVALGVLLGARIGAHIMIYLPSKWVRAIFLPVLLYIAVTMLIKGVRGL